MTSSCTVSETNPANITTRPGTNPSVPLHHLCEDCTRFVARCQILDQLQSPADPRNPLWPYSTYHCTVASLVESQDICHLCKLLAASLHRWRFLKSADLTNKNVYWRARGVEQSVIVHALFSDQQPMSEKDGNFFASFELKTYCGE